MRALDTNVLVRYLTADDRRQLALADQVIAACLREEEPIFVPLLVLCELAWVLDRSYGHLKPDIVRTLELLLQMAVFRVEQTDLVRRALQAYRLGRGSFPDYLILEVSQAAGCRDVVTFDRSVRGTTGFTVLT